MSRVEELESQIKTLSSSEFQELRTWLAEHDAEIRDRQFHAGRSCRQTGRIADRALNDFAENRSTDL
jgi:hypothetical protein